MANSIDLTRRGFLAGTLATAGGFAVEHARGSSIDESRADRPICAFVKHVQQLSFDELAETIADLGFDGIEATVRRGGQIEPKDAVTQLPRLVEALRTRDLCIEIMATDINRVEDPQAETVLRVAADLGVPRYRLRWYRYDLDRPILEQIGEYRRILDPLDELNGELGIQGLYQNHAGANFVGASVWDVQMLLRDRSSEQLSAAFDIRHATVEGGLTWPVLWNLIEPQVGAVCVKDFRWRGREAVNVPLGEGQVDPAFFRAVRASPFDGPLSLHVEYLEQSGAAANVQALRDDLRTLKRWMASDTPSK